MATLTNQIVSLYFRNTLNIFKNLSNFGRISLNLFCRNIAYCYTHKKIYKFKESEACKCNKRNSPVKKEKHYNNKRSIKQPLEDHHYSTGGNITNRLHCICCNRSDFSKAVFVEITHWQVAKMLSNLDTFLSAGTVTTLTLPH